MAEENSSSSIIPVRVKGRLPRVLEEEVQLRLPVKSLVRFKSVCRQWCSRFESRPFMALHDQRHPRGIYNDFSSESRTSSSQELLKMVPGLNHIHDRTKIDHGFWMRTFYVYGPLSNGIYCVTSSHMRQSNGCCPIVSAKIALCNPATRQYEFAEPFPREFRDMLSKTSFSSSDPPSRLYYGFGNVYKINSSSSEPSLDYRVVVIIHYGTRMPYPFLVFVYSFQRRKWRKIVDYRAGRRKIGKPKATDAFDLRGRRIIGICHHLETCCQGFLKGCFHWAVVHRGGSFSVLAFNFADHSFKLMRGPPNHMDHVVDEGVVYDGSSLVLHDHLAFIRVFNVPPSPGSDHTASHTVEIGVWMMMEYGVEESWTRIYTINPEFNGRFNILNGIDYEEDACADGGIHVKRLILTVVHDDDKRDIISCDKVGHQVIASAGSRVSLRLDNVADGVAVALAFADEFIIHWNTPGISTYIETLERL